VIDGLAVGIAVVAVLLGVAGTVLAALDRRPGKPFLQGVLLLQLLLLAQAAVAVTRLVQGDRPLELGAFAGYLLVSVLLVPGGAIWSLEEKSRYGTLILAVVCLVVAVLQQRLLSLWVLG
jgi:hypothetical protein